MKAVGALSPDVAVMENVKQAAAHPGWRNGLSHMGMTLAAMWTLKAFVYGAPTKRERTFWVWRKDGVWPPKPAPRPVETKYPSVISNIGGQFGVRRLEVDTHLYCRVPANVDAKFAERWTILTLEEALEAQGASGKKFCGSSVQVAQQVADMIPPPLAEAVIRAACKGIVEFV
jgi:site-specific DNA-cytosine methylase